MSPNPPVLVVQKIDKQGLPLVHRISVIKIDADISYEYGIFCTYKTSKLSGLLWAHYLNSSETQAKRVAYLLADHLDFAPLWAKYRSGQIEPIATYWAIQAERVEGRIRQLQKSAIISRDPTDDPSARVK